MYEIATSKHFSGTEIAEASSKRFWLLTIFLFRLHAQGPNRFYLTHPSEVNK